jgi:hypothetical protein
VLEYGGWVALFLVLVQIALTWWMVVGEARDRNRIKHYATASVFNILLIAFFWLGNRITEITFSSVGTIKAEADQASQYVSDIKNIKAEVEREQKVINDVAAQAGNASRLSKDLEAKNVQASKQLSELEREMSAAAEASDNLQLAVRYTTTVLAAQSDDRVAFDQLQTWSNDGSFPFAASAHEVSDAVKDNLTNLMLNYQVPWKQGVDPAKFKSADLRAIYSSLEFQKVTNFRVALVQYFATRSDLSQKDRLGFFIDVMHRDPSLKVVAYAGQAFAQVANLNNPLTPQLHMDPLALPIYYDWWKNNQSKLR